MSLLPELFTIVVPSTPSEYLQPYPELELTTTLEGFKAIAYALSQRNPGSAGYICFWVEKHVEVPYAIKVYTAVAIAMPGHLAITNYVQDSSVTVLPDEARAKIRSTWCAHIERSI